jgi:predicted GIY-YIG superfamily endonuclease
VRTVYLIKDANKNIYIGSTSRNLLRRFSEHKSHGILNIDFKTAKIKKITSTVDYINIEEKFIVMAKNKYNQKCLNKSLGCLGPKGLYSEGRALACSKKLKEMWKDPIYKSKIMAGIEKSRAINCVFSMSKKSHELRWSKMPEWIAIEKISGKKFGPYRGYFFAKKELNLHEDTIAKCINKGQENRKYFFEMV